MTLAERAACIADLAAPGSVRGALRRQRVYDKALQMLTEASKGAGSWSCPICGTREVTEGELLTQLEAWIEGDSHA